MHSGNYYICWLPRHQTPHHLVVDHHMDCTMCGVGGELTQVESLIHNSLSSKSSVAMNRDAHHL